MAELSDLQGRVALVTGASRGIGRAIARRLAAHGAAVAVTASARSQDGLRETCDLIGQAGGCAVPLVADLADERARAGLVAQAAAQLGQVDILVNNAATITAYAPPGKIDLPARRGMFEVNFQAPVDLIQQALPGMRQRGWGRLLNITSETAQQPPIPYPGPPKLVHALVLYGASKAALDRYTLGLAAELHGSGVLANALAPYKIARSESAEAVVRQAAAAHPDWVEPVEMMAEAAYLLIAGQLAGLVVKSRELLQRLQAPLHALDGLTVIGDATTLVDFSLDR
ncbi:SDR family NAD(P)-dependent oxidoreductase [Nevskia soli]|uniref:SDR family NAD(P)-dependent oxidoreductase n=1 Tax=Nevskia soli TaxID=418856 RepID=UPI0004A6BD50|nr:SDR family NAD(P)-dependent oxidoreductase [Nevskia soli]